MELIFIVFITLILVMAMFVALTRLRRVTYLIRRENVIEILEMVLDHKATINDWQVFLGVPIRHDPYLEQIRQQCELIDEQEGMVFRNKLLTKVGESRVQNLLEEIKKNDQMEF